MQKPPLKSKRGCLNCLRRRKKCDERVPVCTTCERLSLNCTWRVDGKSDATGRRGEGRSLELVTRPGDDSSPILLVPSLGARTSLSSNTLGSGYKAFRSRTQLELVVQSPQHLGQLISRTAAHDFRDLSFLVSLALQNEWIRDALAAFVAFNTQTVHVEPHAEEQLHLATYQSALINLRQHIVSTQTGAETVEVLTAITFLGIYESLGTGDAQMAIKHFAAAARLTQRISVPPATKSRELVLYRIAVECWLYNLATLAIYHPFPDSVMEVVDWRVLDQAFGTPKPTSQLLLGTSPFIGGIHVLYKLMLQVTWFARQPASPDHRRHMAAQWSNELDRLCKGADYYFEAFSRDVASLYYSKYILHVHAISIMLVKIADHSASSASPTVQRILVDARGVFERNTTHENKNPALAWPLTIFLCASYQSPGLAFFVSTMTDIRDNFDPGHRRRLSAILDVLQRKRQETECSPTSDDDHGSSQEDFDTLDLLLDRNGILG